LGGEGEEIGSSWFGYLGGEGEEIGSSWFGLGGRGV